MRGPRGQCIAMHNWSLVSFLPLGEISERGIAIIVVVRPSVRGQNSWGGFLSPWMVLEIIFLCFPEGWNISWGTFLGLVSSPYGTSTVSSSV